MKEYRFVASSEDAGVRLDILLSNFCIEKKLGVSRTLVKALILKGAVSAKGAAVLTPHYRVKPQDEVRFSIEEKAPLEIKAEQIKFDIVYDDGNTQRINLFGELGYNKNEIVRFSLRGDYYGYSTDKQAEALHKPTYRLRANSSFNIYQKLLLNIGFVGQGGMKSFNNETNGIVNLNPGIDLNVKADYFLSPQVSIFLKFENILSNDYPLYLNYPVRGFQAMGGVSWSF